MFWRQVLLSLAIQCADSFSSNLQLIGKRALGLHKFSKLNGRKTPLKFLMSEELDWRTFRAKLVSQENKAGSIVGSENNASIKGDEWVYDAGKFVETGCVILGGSQMEYGFGLRQQYFHKSVMLVLSQDEKFTKGIIVNRPTSKSLDGWRIWCVSCSYSVSLSPRSTYLQF